MKNKTITRAILILLVALTLITSSFVFQNRALLFDSNSINGESRITLQLLSDVDEQDIRAMLNQASIQSIDIQDGNDGSREAIIRMEYLDTNKREALLAALQKEQVNDVIVLSTVSIGGSISIGVRNTIYIALGIVIAIIIVLLVVYIRAIRSRKEDELSKGHRAS